MLVMFECDFACADLVVGWGGFARDSCEGISAGLVRSVCVTFWLVADDFGVFCLCASVQIVCRRLQVSFVLNLNIFDCLLL